MFKIPKSIEVAGQEWVIELKDKILSDHNNFGMTIWKPSRIEIDSSLAGDDRGITYFHELMHVITKTIGRQDLNEDEGFIDLVGQLLWQSVKTAKFE